MITRPSTRLVSILALIMAAQAFAWSGSGTENDPYLITSTGDMAQLAEDVNSGNTYVGAYFKLANDLDFSTVTRDADGNNYTPIGNFDNIHSIGHGFAGSFDGNNKTISNIAVTHNDDLGTGLFGHTTDAAVIKNLKIESCIFNGNDNVGGVVGRNVGTIENIYVDNTTIGIGSGSTFIDGHGGIVGTNLTGSVKGGISKASVVCSEGITCQNFGGIVGNLSSGNVHNSLYLGTQVKGTSLVGAIAGGKGTGTVFNSFYPQSLGTGGIGQLNSPTGADIAGQAESTRAIESMVTDHDAVSFIEGNPTSTYENGISVYSWGLKYNRTNYYRSNGTIKLDYNGSMFINGFTCSDANESCSISDSTLTIGTGTTTSAGTVTEGSGTNESPYLIESKQDWDRLAIAVSRGNDFSGKVFKLTANISVSTTVSDAERRPFAGTFDGNGKTITAAIDDYEGMQGTALFRYISGATIKNLTVAGSVTGARSTVAHAAGLVGFAWSGNNTIEDVTVSATIAGGTHVGGIVAHGKSSSLTLRNCVFSGTISGGSEFAGGLLGWSDGSTLTLSNNLTTGTYTGPGKFHPVAVRDMNKEMSISEESTSYYTTAPSQGISVAYIAATGTQVYAEPEANRLNAAVTAVDNNIYYTRPESNTIAVEDHYTLGTDPITPSAVVSYNGATLTPDAYTLKYRAEGSEVELTSIDGEGTYTVVVHGVSPFVGKLESPSFAVIKPLQGEGTEESPYIIASEAHWNSLAQWTLHGVTYAGKFLKLAENITVSTMVGTDANKFQGTFDGNNKTISLAYGHTEEPLTELYAAPFRYVNGATIKDLHTSGDIYTSSKFAASIVGFSQGSTNIANCGSEVAIHSSVEGDGTHGGLVANIAAGQVSISNSYFKGSLLGEATYSSGGLVGWLNTNDNAILSMTSCLFAPASVTMGTSSSRTLTRAAPANYYSPWLTIKDCYYTQTFGDAQGERVQETIPENKICKVVNAPDNKTYYYCEKSPAMTVAAYYGFGSSEMPAPTSLKYDGVGLVLGTDYYVTYKAEGSEEETESIEAEGNYVMIVHGTGNYAGSMTSSSFVAIRSLEGEGTEESPYIIASEADWNSLAKWHLQGENYEGRFLELTADITVSTMVGDATHVFRGTFNGKKHTITLAYGSEENPLSELYAAPFRYVTGATIENLRIAGHLYTARKFAASIVGFSQGSTNIANCGSEVAIHSSAEGDGTHGGLVANIAAGQISMTNSYFKGSLLGEATSSSGGLVGWLNTNDYAAKLSMTSCLFAPASVTMGTSSSKTLARAANYSSSWLTIKDCYYTQTFGEAQGERVQETIPENKICKVVNAPDGKVYYNCPQTVNLHVQPYYHIESATTPEPIVEFAGDALTLGTDYTVTYKAESSEEETASITRTGDYTMVIHGQGTYTGTMESAVFSVITELDGEGTEESPYIIASTADWNSFAGFVSEGITYSGKFLRLDADIAINTAVSDSVAHPFSGTFDGNGHTLTASIVESKNKQGAAPFRYIAGATIKNLTVTGSVTGTAEGASHTAGLVGFALSGTNVISGVTVSAEIAGGTHVGGIVAHGKTSSLTITNSVFNGTISGGSTYAGGLLGWSDGSSLLINGAITSGSYTGGGKFHPVALKTDGKTMTSLNIDKCYYTIDPSDGIGSNYIVTTGTQKGTKVYAAVLETDLMKKLLLFDGNVYYLTQTATLSGYKSQYNAGTSTASINPVVKADEVSLTQGRDYIVDILKDGEVVTGTMDEPGEYTLRISGIGDYAGSISATFKVTNELDGNGTAESPYTIANASDWDNFALRVTNGETYGGKFVKLLNDIAVSTMVGIIDGDNRFHGTFDGGNHTITISYGTEENPVGDNAAPFSFATSATIRNLHTSGSIVTNGKYAGGIVGRATARSGAAVTIVNCHSDVSITRTVSGDGSIGGLVGQVASDSIAIKDSYFAGSLLGSKSATNYGGIVGWVSNGAKAYLDNILFKPESVSGSIQSTSNNFVRAANAEQFTLNNCYYTSFKIWDESQGNRAYVNVPSRIYKAAPVTAADGERYYIAADVTGIDEDNLYSIDSISFITPVVHFNGNPLVEGSDYTFELPTITDNGIYEVTVTGTGDFAGADTIEIEVYGSLKGKGTEGDPYIIATDLDWETVGYRVRQGETFDGKFLKMTSDISVTSMIGSDSTAHYFAGTFDGNGHTLTVTIGDKNNAISIIGPFRYINGATIKSLHVNGNVYTRSWNSPKNGVDYCYGRFVAGLVGHAKGNTVISNVIVSASITANNNGGYVTHGNHGGIVGLVGRDANVIIKNSVFNGGLYQESKAVKGNGGFVGEGNSTATLSIENSLFNPTSVTMHMEYSNTFGSWSTVTNSYYTSTAFGTDQGISGIGKTAEELAKLLGYAWHVVDDKALPYYNYSETNYGAVTVVKTEEGTTAHINGNFREKVETVIDNDIQVDAVNLVRTFNTGSYSTIMLPFSIKAGNVDGATFYQLTGFEKVDGKWKTAVVTQIDDNDNLTANTPYLLEASQPTLSFNQAQFNLNTTTGPESHSVTFGNWEFRGTYRYIEYADSLQLIGRAYGFAGQNNDGIKIGEFVKVGSGAWTMPMRAYLVYNEGNSSPKSAIGKASFELPETMDVIIVNSEGKSIGGGTLNTVTGEIRMDRWFDLQGRKLNGKPTTKGTYYHNGKRVIIK
ncbi:MAG: hypothetical protein IKB43_04015 [Fibrobacter sp.]|nr:hypothetical protein [Fibrobacter sp.]